MARRNSKDQVTGNEDIQDLDDRLEAAFRSELLNFPITTESEKALRLAVGYLAYLSTYQGPSPLRQDRKVGHEAARRELNDLAGAAEQFTKRLTNLSATAIVALGSRQHIMRSVVWLTGYLCELALAARSADVNDAPDAIGKGRPQNRRAIDAASIIIGAFEAITGEYANLPANRGHERTRGLVPLAREIFAILGIRANAKAAVEAALNTLQKQQKSARSIQRRAGESAEDFFGRRERAEFAERSSPRSWKTAEK